MQKTLIGMLGLIIISLGFSTKVFSQAKSTGKTRSKKTVAVNKTNFSNWQNASLGMEQITFKLPAEWSESKTAKVEGAIAELYRWDAGKIRELTITLTNFPKDFSLSKNQLLTIDFTNKQKDYRARKVNGRLRLGALDETAGYFSLFKVEDDKAGFIILSWKGFRTFRGKIQAVKIETFGFAGDERLLREILNTFKMNDETDYSPPLINRLVVLRDAR